MTEALDPRTADLDAWGPEDVATAIWESQMAAVAAVAPARAAIAAAAEAAAARLRTGGGRLAYAGAGTSGRLAVQDGSELPPTFDWPEARLLFVIAGGEAAVLQATEGAEDDREEAARKLREAGIGPADVLVGVAASGRTPFTVAALEAARAAGALTIGIANNPGTPVLAAAEHPILLDTGPELIAGSTRMKAGTAQKVVLNMISTQAMIRLGRVYGGLMVEMRPLNDKLRGRATAMVARIAGCDEAGAQAALAATDWNIKRAVLFARGATQEQAVVLLDAAEGSLRRALASL